MTQEGMAMSVQGRPIGRKRWQYRPDLEGLEAREVPSGAGKAVIVTNIVPTPTPSFYPPNTPVKTVYHEPLVPDGSLAKLESFARIIQTSYLQDPLLTAQASNPANALPSLAVQPYAPTVAELEREHFIAKYEGRYTIGPGRFSDQAYTIHAMTRTGGSNQYSRGLAQLFLVEPVVSTTQDANSRVQGVGSNFPYSTLESGSNLITDLTGSTADGKPYGQYVLPTHLTWYEDTTGTGGYTTPFNNSDTAGTLDMVWIPDKTPVAGTLGSGRVIWLYQGLVNTSGILNTIEPTLSY